MHNVQKLRTVDANSETPGTANTTLI